MEQSSSVTELHAQRSTPVTDELRHLANVVASVCPADATIGFCFAQQHLRLTVDVRTYEDARAVEAVLPTIAGGIFGGLARSGTPSQSFRRRITAIVER